MKDSGWYYIDEGVLEPLVWGQNVGCEFYNEDCIENDIAAHGMIIIFNKSL